MITCLVGDILKTEAQALVNTVNCEGYMGKGIAYQFKMEFPENYKIYKQACMRGEFKTGNILLCTENRKVIVNFPTKNEWRKKSEYRYIEDGLDMLIKKIVEHNITSIAIPPLGCGNGGLEWSKIKPLIVSKLKSFDKLDVFLYEPSKYYSSTPKIAPKISQSHCVLMEIKENLNKFSKFRLQKTAYLVDILRKDDYFKFDSYKFGPYSNTINILSKDIKEFQEYHNIKTKDALVLSEKTLTSANFDSSFEKFKNSIQKASHIVNEITDDEYLELLTSVIFVIRKSGRSSYDQIAFGISSWSPRKERIAEANSLKCCISDLEKMGIVKLNIFGEYELK